MDHRYKFFAFISYNSRDTEWGKRVQRKLEHYRMPATLCRERGWKRRPLIPVFFAPTDILPGGLDEELKARLRASRNLIVICSPNSAKSEWVGKEIEYFHSLGRTKNIHFFIVDGVPHSGNDETECFNKVVDTLGLPEILGANVNEKIYRWPWLNRERAYVQLISKLLGVEFDDIWQRHRRRLVGRLIAWIVGVLTVLALLIGTWWVNRPVDVSVTLNETNTPNRHLPPMKDAIVTMMLDNETKCDTISNVDDKVSFPNVPHRFIGSEVHLTVQCRNYCDVDTTVVLAENMIIDIKRDNHVFGDVKFGIWDYVAEKRLPGVSVSVAGIDAVADDSGQISLYVPLDRQRAVYHVTASVPLEYDSIHMPCGKNVILTRKQ